VKLRTILFAILLANIFFSVNPNNNIQLAFSQDQDEGKNFSGETIEGEHIIFFLRETSTGRIPTLALNSSWSTITPNIDGKVEKEEWKDAFETEIEFFSSSKPGISDIYSIGKLFLKNNNVSLYLAFNLTADTSDDYDAVFILSTTSEFALIFSTTNIPDDQKGVYWKTGFNTHRMWEIKIPLSELPDLQIIPINIRFPNNGKNNVVHYEWPDYKRNLALASSISKNAHKNASFIKYVFDLIKVLDQSYELFQDLYNYTPYDGEKIAIVVNYTLKYTGLSGNPIKVKHPYSLGTYLHELGHDFTIGGFRVSSESLAQLSEVYPTTKNITSNNILLESYLRSNISKSMFSETKQLLFQYENNESKFEEIDIFTEEYIPPRQAINIFKGILCNLIETYGWDILSKNTYPCTIYDNLKESNIINKNFNILVYRLSLGAKEDLRNLFQERWRMPIIENNRYILSETFHESQVIVETNSIVDVTSYHYFNETPKITFSIISSPKTVDLINIKMPRARAREPYSIKINNRTLLNNYYAPLNQSHAFISFNINQSFNNIEIIGKYSDLEPPKTSHNYDWSIKKQDFRITLNATDAISGVSETFYRINGGSIKKISKDGQPKITQTGYNNVEYWSIDNVNNEESHKNIFDIMIEERIRNKDSFDNNPKFYLELIILKGFFLLWFIGAPISIFIYARHMRKTHLPAFKYYKNNKMYLSNM
jgi:hypothetical protein